MIWSEFEQSENIIYQQWIAVCCHCSERKIISALGASVMEVEQPGPCDRRLSRAARELMREHLVDAWKAAYLETRDAKYDLDVSEWNIWQLLEVTLVDHLADEACPLAPERDIHKVHEEHSFVVETNLVVPRNVRNCAIPGLLRAGMPRDAKNNPLVNQCGLCMKNFTSHFYLDRHWDRHHSEEHKINIVCPAVKWCDFLSQTSCHDTAMQLEPHYGPGSAGYGTDQHTVHHNLLLKQPTCSDTHQLDAATACRDVMHKCFSDSAVGRYLTSKRCAIPTCQARLLRKLLGSVQRSDQWNGLFTDYTDTAHHGLGWLGLSVLITIAAYYGQHWWATLPSRRHRATGNLLVGRQQSTLNIAAPTTYIGIANKSKEN